jgi:large subunit ribosomal protein L5
MIAETETKTKAEIESVMRKIAISAVTLNIGSGIVAEDADKAALLLERLSGTKSVKTFSKKRIPTWKIRPGLAVGARVTIRGKQAIELLKRLLTAVDNELKQKSFTENGFSFGIKEYVDIPNAKYDPKIGIIGLDVIVSLKRPGYRIARKKIKRARIGTGHRISAKDAWEWAQKEFGVKPKAEA